LPAALILDSVTRLLPGALGNEDSAVNESFAGERQRQDPGSKGEPGAPTLGVDRVADAKTGAACRGGGLLLDFPHYTRPAEFRGWSVPEVLVGGNHAEVAKWRRAAALEKTRRNRPDLLG
jgi:tRNA (guanine37-N1)-methyltransferase